MTKTKKAETKRRYRQTKRGKELHRKHNKKYREKKKKEIIELERIKSTNIFIRLFNRIINILKGKND